MIGSWNIESRFDLRMERENMSGGIMKRLKRLVCLLITSR